MEEVDLLGRPLHAQPSLASLLALETSTQAVNFGEMLSDGASDSGLCALEGCNRARQYEVGCDWDRCCKRCFVTEGQEHDQWCDERACDNGQRSIAETEGIMSVEEGDRNARSRPAAAEEDDTTAATRAAAATDQENDVCSVCQYRGRKI